MDIISIMLVVLRVAICAILAIFATRKSLGQCVLNIVAFGLSFSISIALTYKGAFNFIGSMISKPILKIDMIDNLVSQSDTLKQFVVSFTEYVVNTFVFAIIAILLYLLFALIVKLIVKSPKVSAVKFFAPSESVGIQIGAAAITFVISWFLIACVFVPFTAVLDVARPAIDEAKAQEDTSTYTYEVADKVENNYTFATSKSISHLADKYTGSYAFEEFTLSYLGKANLQTAYGEEYTENISQTLVDVLKSGISAINAYEKVQITPTYGSLSSALDVLDTVKGSPMLTNIARDFIKTIDTSKSPVLNSLDNVLKSYLTPKGDENLDKDIDTIKSLASKFIKKNENKQIDNSSILNDLIEYATDKETSKDFAKDISSLTIFNDAIDGIMEFGIKSLCEQLELDYNKEDAYSSFVTKMIEVVNNKGRGKINFDSLESFISNLSSSGYPVSNYRTDGEYKNLVENYDRYMEAMKDFKKVTNEFGTTSSDYENTFTHNGKSYRYSLEEDKWSEVTTPDADGILFEHLLAIANDNIDSGETMTQESFKETLTNDHMRDILIAQFGQLKEEILSSVSSIASAYSSSEDVFFDITLGEDIVYGLNTIESLSEESTSALADVLYQLGEIYKLLSSKENFDDIYSFVLDNFGRIGKLFDTLRSYEKTRDLPEYILKVLSQKTLISSYVSPSDIQGIVDSVNNGEITYEAMFASVAAMYKLATLVK